MNVAISLPRDELAICVVEWGAEPSIPEEREVRESLDHACAKPRLAERDGDLPRKP